MDQQKRYRSDLIERHLSLMSKRGRLKRSQVPEYRRELQANAELRGMVL